MKKCIYYHKQDRRRPLGTYSSVKCQFTQEGCPNGDHCHFSHNRVEEFYHPEKYKTKFCKNYPD